MNPLKVKASAALKEYEPLVFAALQTFKGKKVADENGANLYPEVRRAMPRHPDKNILVDTVYVGDGYVYLYVVAFEDVENPDSISETAEREMGIAYVTRKGILSRVISNA